jgi:hypothetical protein
VLLVRVQGRKPARSNFRSASGTFACGDIDANFPINSARSAALSVMPRRRSQHFEDGVAYFVDDCFSSRQRGIPRSNSGEPVFALFAPESRAKHIGDLDRPDPFGVLVAELDRGPQPQRMAEVPIERLDKERAARADRRSFVHVASQ